MAIAIETATVQIRTLNVGTKSMTQGIFRQLPDQSVISTTGSIDGTPWGVVNYHPERCEDAKMHLHVVWQLGEELRRCSVSSPENALFEHPEAARYAMALVSEGAFQGDPNSPLDMFRSSERGGGARARVQVRGVLFWASLPLPFLQAWQMRRGDLEDLQAVAMEHFGTGLAPSAEIADLLPVDAYKASWRSLSGLPQLFIGR